MLSAMSATAGEPLIAIEGLGHVFRRGAGDIVAALVDVSFEVRAGEIVGVVGPNGAGKTTLVDVLATTITATTGQARICGFDIRREAGAVRRHIGYVPAGARAIYPRLTVRRNLDFFAALYGLGRREARSRVAEALRLMGAQEVAHVRADRVSDGMIARVALSRAILHDPAVLLLDEPTRSIDPMHRPVILRAIRAFVNQAGKAAVMVTHTVEDLYQTCDRVAVLRAGRLASMIPVTRSRGSDAMSHVLAEEVYR